MFMCERVHLNIRRKKDFLKLSFNAEKASALETVTVFTVRFLVLLLFECHGLK